MHLESQLSVHLSRFTETGFGGYELPAPPSAFQISSDGFFRCHGSFLKKTLRKAAKPRRKTRKRLLMLCVLAALREKCVYDSTKMKVFPERARRTGSFKADGFESRGSVSRRIVNPDASSSVSCDGFMSPRV